MLKSAWRFRSFMRRFLPAFGWGAVLVVADTLTDLAQPWPLKVIIAGAIFDTLVPNVVMLVGLAVVMIWLDPGFGLLALAIAPPLFFVTYRYTTRIKLAARRAREADARIAAHANETLAAVRSVQAFSREEFEDERFAVRNEESL